MMEKDHHGERKGGCEVSGWTTSYRWAPVRREKVRGLVNHHARDVDAQHGREVSHSNEGIVADRTRLNVTMVNDGNGGFVECTDSGQWKDYLDGRLEEVGHTWRTQKDGSRKPVALRKDAAVAVDYVLQLDPDFTGSAESLAADPEKDEEVRRLLAVMVDEVVEQHGQQNVIGWTLHLDEENPHIQMLAIPVVDGCTSYKQFFGDAEPGKRSTKAGSMRAYAERHDEMRHRLRDHGYEATFERVAEGLEHVPLAKYKTNKDKRRAEREDIAAREAVVSSREQEQLHRSRAQSFRGSLLDEQEQQLEEREQQLEEREASLEDEALARADQAVAAARRELDERRESLEAEIQRFRDGERSLSSSTLHMAYWCGLRDGGGFDAVRQAEQFKQRFPTVADFDRDIKQQHEAAEAKRKQDEAKKQRAAATLSKIRAHSTEAEGSKGSKGSELG